MQAAADPEHPNKLLSCCLTLQKFVENKINYKCKERVAAFHAKYMLQITTQQ
jgi:hypothetical protein